MALPLKWTPLVLLAAEVVLSGCAQFSAPPPRPEALPPVSRAPAAAKNEAVVKADPPREANPKPLAKGNLDENQMSLARLSERQGQFASAAQVYRSMIEKNPRNPMPYHRLGVIAAQQGKFADAEQNFSKARELGPPSTDLLSDIGYAYYLQHRLPEAEQVLKQAHEQEPHHAATCNNLGLVLGELGRFPESLALFKQAGSEAEAYCNLAYVFTQLGELDRAQANYSHALSLESNLRPAAEAMIQVAQNQKRRKTGAPAGRDAAQSNEIAQAGQPRTQPRQAARSLPSDELAARDPRLMLEKTPVERPGSAPDAEIAAAGDRTPADQTTSPNGEPDAGMPGLKAHTVEVATTDLKGNGRPPVSPPNPEVRRTSYDAEVPLAAPTRQLPMESTASFASRSNSQPAASLVGQVEWPSAQKGQPASVLQAHLTEPTDGRTSRTNLGPDFRTPPERRPEASAPDDAPRSMPRSEEARQLPPTAAGQFQWPANGDGATELKTRSLNAMNSTPPRVEARLDAGGNRPSSDSQFVAPAVFNSIRELPDKTQTRRSAEIEPKGATPPEARADGQLNPIAAAAFSFPSDSSKRPPVEPAASPLAQDVSPPRRDVPSSEPAPTQRSNNAKDLLYLYRARKAQRERDRKLDATAAIPPAGPGTEQFSGALGTGVMTDSQYPTAQPTWTASDATQSARSPESDRSAENTPQRGFPARGVNLNSSPAQFENRSAGWTTASDQPSASGGRSIR